MNRRRIAMAMRGLLGLGMATWMACASAPASKPVATGAPVGPSPAAQAPLPIPPDLAARVKTAETLGQTLYVLDKASAIGSDVLLAQVPPPGRRGLAGWVTFQEGDAQGHPVDSFAVLFLTNENPARLAYTIHVPAAGRPALETFSPPRAPVPGVVLLHRARQRAVAAVPHGKRHLNPVVVPGDVLGYPGKILVYVLAAEQVPGEMVFGVHYRVRVSEDGNTVEDVQPLSKSELVVGSPASQGVPADAKDVEAMVSHILDDSPIETHVFVSLLHGATPILVTTARGLWEVKGAKISFLSPLPSSTAPGASVEAGPH